MKVIRDIKDINFIEKKRYIALGVFDGIHLGHRNLIESTVDRARKNNGLSIVVTFEPHPDRIIFPDKNIMHITTLEEKIEIIRTLGVDILFILKFGPWIRNMQPNVFLFRILNEKLGANEIFVGFNYKFGYKGKGDIELLKKYEKLYNYKSNILDPKTVNGKIVSSTLIKKYIEKGNIKEAAKLLGNKYSISGKVIKGENIGKKVMKIPTANLMVHEDKIIPGNGVYLTEVMIDRIKYHGLMNIGKRPTFKGENRTIEVYIMDFDKNIYKKDIVCYVLDKIRDEKYFDSAEKLRKQIMKDVSILRKLKNSIKRGEKLQVE
ncbi:MAG: bifunctional riboflavin kinase/FAD synthetase [Candidatus Caldatribacteriota bacterium]|nr:bifunctional riboflavin kinase/FAD synthetase [Candidatus Caldatribacteriota bacterium]